MPRAFLQAALIIAATWTAAAEPPAWEASLTKDPPTIDGGFDDACWLDRTQVDNFRDVKTGEAAGAQTQFCVLYDQDALYFAVVCQEPDMAALRADLTAHDDTLWCDDCVELFIDPGNHRQSYAHIIINANGAAYDSWMTHAGASIDMDYESGVEAAGQKNADSWQVELRIPFAGLRLPRDVGPTWGFNICREKKTEPRELTCWSPPLAGGFHHPESFGALTGLRANFRALLITVNTPTLADPHFEDRDLVGTLVIPYVNWTGGEFAVDVKATFTDRRDEPAETLAHSGVRKGAGNLRIPVIVGEPGLTNLQLELRRRPQGRLVHRGRYAMRLDHRPIEITFLNPAYRDTIYASQPSSEIVCHIKVNAPRKERIGCELRATFNAGITELAVRRVKRLPPSGETQVAFSSEIVPAGEYVVKAQAIKGGVVIAQSEKIIRKLKPRAHEVIVDQEGQLRVDGRKFFPLGFMGAGPDEALAKAGFNTIHTYVARYIHRDEDLNAWLDEARALGLKVIMYPYPGKVGFYGYRDKAKITEADLAEIREFVDAYKSHPALLGWYMCDEPRGAAWRAGLEDVYRVIAEADPFHPCIALDNGAATVLKLRNAADILWIDPYPGFARGGGPREPLTMVARALEDIRAGLSDDCPVWIAPQAFSYAEWNEARRETERAPSFAEVRCMNYLALLNGADGIIPFAWAYAQRHPSTRNAYLQSVGPEMAILMPAIVDGEEIAHCRAVPVSAGADVQVKAWKHEGSFYIVAVNRKPEDARARLHIPGLTNQTVKALAERRRIQALGNVLDETFAPYGVHVYSNRKRLPSLTSLSQIERHIANDEAAQTATW